MSNQVELPDPSWVPFREICVSEPSIICAIGNQRLGQVLSNLGTPELRIKGGHINFGKATWVVIFDMAPLPKYHLEFPLFEGYRSSSWRSVVETEQAIAEIEQVLSDISVEARNFFHNSLSRQDLDYHGRIGSPVAPAFALLPTEMLSYFEVENIHNGTLICKETGERIFSVHIQLLAPEKTSSKRKKPYLEADAPLVEEMEREISKGHISAWAAAKKYAPKAAGNGTEESKTRRLFERLKELSRMK
jgi:hypothetical protein